jgi:gamma-tubulin complex component 2
MLEKASSPFFEMVEKWIYKGIVSDPYEEFFVIEREDLKKENINEDYNDVYWEERFTLSQEHLPSFFSAFGEKILVTGKYLNVIR